MTKERMSLSLGRFRALLQALANQEGLSVTAYVSQLAVKELRGKFVYLAPDGQAVIYPDKASAERQTRIHGGTVETF